MKTNRGKGYFYWRGQLDAKANPWLKPKLRDWPSWAVLAYRSGFAGWNEVNCYARRNETHAGA